MTTAAKFEEFLTNNPCSGCQAPCCQLVMIPYRPPVTFMDIDYIKYLLNFPAIDLAVAKTGDWSILIRDTCQHFDRETHLCNVHGTDEKPLTCRNYNQYQCWYKPNFSLLQPRDIYIINKENFADWLELISFDENGEITSAPDFEQATALFSSAKASARAEPQASQIVPSPLIFFEDEGSSGKTGADNRSLVASGAR